MNIIRIAGMSLGLAVAVAAVQPATATAFTFTTTSKTDGTASSATYYSDGGGQLGMRVTAWHATDTAVADVDTIRAATLGLYTPGIGVLDTASGETYGGNQHQIDNINGVDFVMLQFSQAVNLTGISRAVFALDGIATPDSDAAYWADTTGAVGTAATWKSAVNLANYTVRESLWSSIPGTSVSGPTNVTTSRMASVWLVGADFLGTRNDGFKLSSVTVNTVAPSVPEPATWAMMVVGFGALGASLRRRRAIAPAAITYG